MTDRKNEWRLIVDRHEVHSSAGKKRTYGSYKVLVGGQAAEGLSGFMCESRAPGDNDRQGNGRRVEAGTYPLWTQFGRYKTIGYSTDTAIAGANPMPGLLLRGTGNRIGILIHPGHPPNLYLSSVGCLNPTDALFPRQTMDFWDSRRRVTAFIESLKGFCPAAFRHEATTRIEHAWVEINGEPSDAHLVTAERSFTAAMDQPASLPISKRAAETCARWLVNNFGRQLKAATNGKPYGIKHLCAIACQETAYKWLGWVDKMSPQEIVERCVFDASGDYPGAPRTAFPKNTLAFLDRYGPEFTAMLIEEANKTRRLQDYSDREWVYKGYGIFQYDLQHVKSDEQFFRERQWYDFDICLQRCCDELDKKLKDSGNDLWDAIRRYNGSGPRAQIYMENVKEFTDYCAAVTGD